MVETPMEAVVSGLARLPGLGHRGHCGWDRIAGASGVDLIHGWKCPIGPYSELSIDQSIMPSHPPSSSLEQERSDGHAVTHRSSDSFAASIRLQVIRTAPRLGHETPTVAARPPSPLASSTA